MIRLPKLSRKQGKQGKQEDPEKKVDMDVKKDERFKRIYQKYRTKIYWYIFRKISQAEKAEDITADVFLKLYENWDKVKGRSNKGLTAWLYTVARNASIDHLRKEGRRKIRSSDNEEIDSATKVYDDFVEDAMKEEEIAMIYKAVHLISDDEQEVMTLRFEEGLKFSEIGKVVGKKEGACKMMFYRGIRKVRDNLNKQVSS